MDKIDVIYIADALASLTGIPLRIYQNGVECHKKSVIALEKDPVVLVKDELFRHHEHIGFLLDDYFFYYVFINYDDYLIVIGPSRSIKADNQTLRKIAFDIDIENVNDFLNAMNLIITMPIKSLLEAMGMVNYILNNEKIDLAKMILPVEENSIVMPKQELANINDLPIIHNTYQVERDLCEIIENGDISKLDSFIKNIPSFKSGTLSNDMIRQEKDTFLISLTLSSRAAIKGGLDVDESLGMSDMFAQKCELLTNVSDIQNLQYQMVHQYTKSVSKIKGAKTETKVRKYVLNHLSDPINLDVLSKYCYMSKTTLCETIKKETGHTVNELIHRIKIDESKELLSSTNKSISSISNYLGYSSQSHFQRVFKREVGISPLEYRKKY